METTKNENNGLKQALQRRQTEQLPSNFSFRMMEQIHREAAKQQKRRERTMFYSIVAAVLVLIAFTVYVLIVPMGVSLGGLFPRVDWQPSATPMFMFYLYIGVLVLALLGFDYWMRRKKSLSS